MWVLIQTQGLQISAYITETTCIARYHQSSVVKCCFFYDLDELSL